MNNIFVRSISVSFLVLVLLVAGAFAILGYNVWQNRQAVERTRANQREIRALAASTHETLCIVRTNLAGRLARAEEYNADVKSGKRPLLPGFSLRELEKDVAEQQATLKGLGTLRCGEGS